MTLLDAILTVIGALWAIISAPIAVLFYVIVVLFMAAAVVLAGFQPQEYDGEFPVWERMIFWLIGLAIAIFGISIFVWMAASSDGPFFWRAA